MFGQTQEGMKLNKLLARRKMVVKSKKKAGGALGRALLKAAKAEKATVQASWRQ